MPITTVAIALLLAGLAGLMRGVTGFGGAMVLAAPLAVLVGPTQAVLIAVLLEAFAAGQMVPDAWRTGTIDPLVPIWLAACLTVPIGSYLRITVDPELMRRGITVVVVLFGLVMLKGFRYHGPPRLHTSLVVGTASGVLAGATSLGGPPVILYLLSGPQPIAVTRANLTLTIMAVSIATVLALWVGGAMEPSGLGFALLLSPLFFLGVWTGGRVFRYLDERRFRSRRRRAARRTG